MRIGVLALQGGFARHVAILQGLSAEPVEVRHATQLEGCAGLILPGGESTTLVRQLAYSGLDVAIASFAEEQSLFGTCAGLIVMADTDLLGTSIPLSLLDAEVTRNGYGRQVASFSAALTVALPESYPEAVRGVFIRAPIVTAVGAEVNVLSEYEGTPVLMQQGRHLAAAFHPELTDDATIHRYFLSLCQTS